MKTMRKKKENLRPVIEWREPTEKQFSFAEGMSYAMKLGLRYPTRAEVETLWEETRGDKKHWLQKRVSWMEPDDIPNARRMSTISFWVDDVGSRENWFVVILPDYGPDFHIHHPPPAGAEWEHVNHVVLVGDLK